MIVSTPEKDNFTDFEKLLSDCLSSLDSEAYQDVDYFLNRGGVKFEDDLLNHMNMHAKGTLFSGKIKKISGQKFPDIVAWINQNKGYGVEVKTSKLNHWKTTGNSIFESTRVSNIERVYMFFGKLADPIQFKYKKYQDCLYDVAITHSPRYLIDMEIDSKETIFSKVGVEYEQLRQLENPFAPIKEYYKREILKKGEEVWWVDNEESNISSLAIRAWSNLENKDQELLINTAMILFPEIFSKSQDKFNRVATWLIMHHGVINPSLRDTFSAGGKKEIIINNIPYTVPAIFNRLQTRINNIIDLLENIDPKLLEYYWETTLENNLLAQWVKLASIQSYTMLPSHHTLIEEMVMEQLK